MRALAAAALAMAGCAEAPAPDVGLEGLAVDAVGPALVVPGSELVVNGRSFVPETWGETILRLRGDGVDLALPARFVEYDQLRVAIDGEAVAAIGDRRLGTAAVEVTAVDGAVHASTPIAVALAARPSLAPALAAVASGGVVFVNDAIALGGDGFLLGGGEGQTVAVVTGCTVRDPDAACSPGPATAIPVVASHDRRRAEVALAPAAVGIEPGHFRGELHLENRHAGGVVTRTAARAVRYQLVAPSVFALTPTAVHLGQYVAVDGGGFVAGGPGAGTSLHLEGVLTGDDGAVTAVDVALVAEVVAGRRGRYVVSEDDALGAAVDLRAGGGTLIGTVTPEVVWAGTRVRGDATPVALRIGSPVQVVYLDFRPGYVEALRLFGLRAVDHEIRRRAADVVRAAYAGVAVDVRTTMPADVALWSHVEIGGEDPNAMGLFGYDNSPGKDSGNLRLHDRIGGVNAETQADGAPGYGGVFVASLMGLSAHPPLGEPLPDGDPLFDAIFDPLRPDRGREVRAADAAGLIMPTSSAGCPAQGRPAQIACAVWALGSLIGTTIAHEVGHSLGLANPYGSGFHAAGDRPDRLMDAGGARPLRERAELLGQGPGRFCPDEHAYLRAILPAPDPAPTLRRPPCD
jgi:hypothetical protein